MKHWLLLGSLLTSTVCSAQNLLGLSTSRYGGTNRLFINPALAADSPSKLYLNVFTASIHANNNYVRYQAPFSLLRLITNNVPDQYRSADGSLQFSSTYTEEILDGRPKNGTVWGEVRGPSILIRSGERSAVGITTRLRAVGQVTGASESLLSAVRASLSDGALYGVPSSNNQFAANTSTFSELGLTYATTLLDADGQQLTLGATVKGLLGYNAQYLINRGLDYRISSDDFGAYLDVTRLDATLGYTTYLQNRTLNLSTLLNPSAPGIGVGLDLGLSYKYQTDPAGPVVQFGAALADVGGLSYKGEAYSYAGVGQNPVRFRGSDFNNVNSAVEIARTLQERLNTGREAQASRFRSGLPTSLNLTADFTNERGLGLNVTYLQDMRSKQAVTVHRPTLLAVTPRYETRYVSVALPVSYLNRALSVGAMVRVGPAWLGSDNFFGLIGNASNGIHPRGLDVYGGLAFGIGRIDAEE